MWHSGKSDQIARVCGTVVTNCATHQGEVKGIEMMGVLVAGRGARERGGRRLEVEVKR